MQFLRKIVDKAKEAKGQFDEHRRAEQESTLAQTERRLDALQLQLKEKEALLLDKERMLKDEESRLHRISSRPKYVLVLCTFVYGAVTILVLNNYDLVPIKRTSFSATSTGDTQAQRPAATVNTAPSLPTNYPSERDASIQETYRGIDLTRPNFDVGGHCLSEEKKGHITFEQCIGLAMTKAAAEGRK